VRCGARASVSAQQWAVQRRESQAALCFIDKQVLFLVLFSEFGPGLAISEASHMLLHGHFCCFVYLGANYLYCESGVGCAAHHARHALPIGPRALVAGAGARRRTLPAACAALRLSLESDAPAVASSILLNPMPVPVLLPAGVLARSGG
jgi:hypothetical protein